MGLGKEEVGGGLAILFYQVYKIYFSVWRSMFPSMPARQHQSGLISEVANLIIVCAKHQHFPIGYCVITLVSWQVLYPCMKIWWKLKMFRVNEWVDCQLHRAAFLDWAENYLSVSLNIFHHSRKLLAPETNICWEYYCLHCL